MAERADVLLMQNWAHVVTGQQAARASNMWAASLLQCVQEAEVLPGLVGGTCMAAAAACEPRARQPTRLLQARDIFVLLPQRLTACLLRAPRLVAVFEALNRIPKDGHGVDMMRVRDWALR